MKNKKELTCDIVEHLGVLSKSKKGWTKELNRVSWEGGDPKFDIRDWAPDRNKPTKGITFSEEEAKKIMELLIKYFEENDYFVPDEDAAY